MLCKKDKSTHRKITSSNILGRANHFLNNFCNNSRIIKVKISFNGTKKKSQDQKLKNKVPAIATPATFAVYFNEVTSRTLGAMN